jgi:hypothetical protein
MSVGATRSATRSPTQMSWQADLACHMVQGPLHSQTAWDIRSSPRMHRAFTELWGTDELFVHVAGFNLKPPVSLESCTRTGVVVPTSTGTATTSRTWLGHHPGPRRACCTSPIPRRTAVASASSLACFHTVLQNDPAFAAELQARRTQHPDNAPGGCMDLEELTGRRAVSIAGRAGDPIIWNSLLPGTSKHVSSHPRRAMSVSTSPVARMVGAAAAASNGAGGASVDLEEAKVRLIARRVYAWQHQLAAPEGSADEAGATHASSSDT